MMDRQSMITVIRNQNGSTSRETVVSLSILLLLVVISVLILLRQSHFDNKYFNASVMQTGQAGTNTTVAVSQNKDSLVINVAPPEGFAPMSDQESFDQISLSDKIDGKADGYLQAGFVRLACKRFAKVTNQAQWFEFYLYDMGLPRNAFSVYSSQKREGVTPQTFTEFAYSTDNALFFACGKYYVEIISALQDRELIESLIAMSKDFIAKQAVDNAKLPELDYLPAGNLDRGSISLLSKNGFGYDKFDNVITATYIVQGKKITAFISIRETKEKAEALAKGYDETLSEFVGKERIKPDTDQIPGLIIADVFDEYEMFFTKGNIIAGIHSAPDKKLGEEIALKLYNKIKQH
jgi:hypothetical protein